VRGARRWKAWVVVAAAWSMTACFRATFESARSPERETHRLWVDGYFYGLVGAGELDTRFFCEGLPANVGVRQNAGTVVLMVLTLGIYTPRIAEITCEGAPAARRGS
jgi:Bor protein